MSPRCVPATGQTIYQTDWVGSWANESETELIERAFQTSAIVEGEITVEGIADETRMVAIPVVHDGPPIAVLTRESIEKAGRRPGELERAYNSVFKSFVRMIAIGDVPVPAARRRLERRAACGRRCDVARRRRVRSSTSHPTPTRPCTGSASRRLRSAMRLAELGFHDGPVRQAFERQVPVIEEFEQGDGVTLLCRCVPFLESTRRRRARSPVPCC